MSSCLFPRCRAPVFNLIYGQLLFTVRGAHEESVQGEGGGG